MERGADHEIEVFEPLSCPLGASSDVAQRILEKTVSHGPKEDHPVTDLSGELQGLRPTRGNEDRNRGFYVDPATSRVQEPDHSLPISLGVGDRLSPKEAAADPNVVRELREP